MSDEKEIVMEDVREYCEGLPVTVGVEDGRIVIIAENEDGYNSTAVDLLDVLEWVEAHKEQIDKLKAEIEAE